MSKSLRLAGLVPFLVHWVACGGGGGTDAGRDYGPKPDIPYLQDTYEPPEETFTGNHPPVLAKIGDRVVAVGETLSLVLQATDADSDSMSYSVYGDIPEGGKFDKATHTFTWIPLQAGQIVYLTFVVSDGKAIDRETVEIKVVAEKVGHPPVFEKVSDQKVTVGKAMTLGLEAHDPDGDTLTFSISGTPPAGSKLNASTGEFSWTPAPEVDKTIVKVTFVVTDPLQYKDTAEVRFIVGETTQGSPPKFVPVEDQEAKVGQPVSFVVKATDPAGTTVTLAVQSGMPATATFDPASGKFAWTPAEPDAGKAFEVVFQATAGEFSSFLTVRIHVATSVTPPTCSPDEFEPNDTAEAAKALGEGTRNLSICDAASDKPDWDFFTIALKKGDLLSVTVTFQHALGDIDTDLSLDGAESTIVAESYGSTDTEHFEYVAEETRAYVLLVFGKGAEQYASPYKLEIAIESSPPACVDDDYEDNDTAGTASTFLAGGEPLKGLVLCPGDADFFRIELAQGDSIIAAATPGTGELAMELLDSDGYVADQATMGSGPATVAADKVAPGDWLVRIHSDGKATYILEMMVEKAATGCDAKSCPVDTVCDAAKGKCVTDLCETSDDCPGGLPCIQTYCVDKCDSGTDCRDGYACKIFQDGRFCGPVGDRPTGLPCTYFSQCKGDLACLFPKKGGYCAVYGCDHDSDCPAEESRCFAGPPYHFCAATCTDDGDCNTPAGFTCKSAKPIDGGEAKLCLP